MKSRATKTYRKACWMAFLVAKPRTWKACAVVIDVEYRCTRGCGGYAPMDEDNARASLKSAIDGMRDARVAPNDSKKWVTWGRFVLLTSLEALAGRMPGVTITVRAA
jgi:hypothetical protein